MRFYSEDVVNKILDDCVQALEAKKKLSEIPDKECLTMDTFSLSEEDTIALMYPDRDEPNYISGISSIIEYFREIYPNNPSFAIISDVDVLIQNADDAIAMLDAIKAKISIVRDTPADKKIVL